MKIAQEVMAILSTALAVDENRVRIVSQLDRKLYTKVNTVLEAMGGTWNRKARAHVFVGPDPAEAIEQALATGEVLVAKVDLAFFPTPAPLAQQLVAWAGVTRGMRVLEPSAGTGRIVDAIIAAGGNPFVFERDRAMNDALTAKYIEGYAKSAWPCAVTVMSHDDFLTAEPPEGLRVDAVVMNPPFQKVGEGDHLNHVRHAARWLRPGGALVSVLPCSVEFRQDKRYAAFREWALERGEFMPLPEGAFKESGTAVRTVALRWRAP